MAGGIWVCFFAFWGAQHLRHLAWYRSHQVSEGIGAPFMLGSGYFCYGGSPPRRAASDRLLSAPSKFKTTAEFLHFFVPSLTGMVGFWATVALNIPDFTRYAKSQRDQC